MNKVLKYAAAATLTGALAIAAATPSHARHGWNGAAIGSGAGALVGAAAANAAYNNGYYYGPDYGYAYEPAPVYGGPYVYGYSYDDYYPNRWQDTHSTNNFSIDSQR